mgnify:CR=1 FL=1
MWERSENISELEERHYQELKYITDSEGLLFKEVLKKYIPDEFRPTRVLNICAGLVAEEDLILDYFGLNVDDLVSVDKSYRNYFDAKKIGKRTITQRDLFNNDDFKSIGYGFDLIIGRNVPLNPDLFKNNLEVNKEWLDVFKNLRNISTENCLMFLTLFQDHEFFTAKKILEMSGFGNFLVAERNRIKIPSKTNLVPDKYKDNFVLVATSKSVK